MERIQQIVLELNELYSNRKSKIREMASIMDELYWVDQQIEMKQSNLQDLLNQGLIPFQHKGQNT